MQQMLGHCLRVAAGGVHRLMQLLDGDAKVDEPALNLLSIVEIDWNNRRLIHGQR